MPRITGLAGMFLGNSRRHECCLDFILLRFHSFCEAPEELDLGQVEVGATATVLSRLPQTHKRFHSTQKKRRVKYRRTCNLLAMYSELFNNSILKMNLFHEFWQD